MRVPSTSIPLSGREGLVFHGKFEGVQGLPSEVTVGVLPVIFMADTPASGFVVGHLLKDCTPIVGLSC